MKVRWPTTLLGWTIWGALVDFAALCVSFLYFAGSHGPAGPMLVLGLLNAPVTTMVNRIWQDTSNAVDAVLLFAIPLVNGALYGLIVGVVMKLWHHLRA